MAYIPYSQRRSKTSTATSSPASPFGSTVAPVAPATDTAVQPKPTRGYVPLKQRQAKEVAPKLGPEINPKLETDTGMATSTVTVPKPKPGLFDRVTTGIKNLFSRFQKPAPVDVNVGPGAMMTPAPKPVPIRTPFTPAKVTKPAIPSELGNLPPVPGFIKPIVNQARQNFADQAAPFTAAQPKPAVRTVRNQTWTDVLNILPKIAGTFAEPAVSGALSLYEAKAGKPAKLSVPLFGGEKLQATGSRQYYEDQLKQGVPEQQAFWNTAVKTVGDFSVLVPLARDFGRIATLATVPEKLVTTDILRGGKQQVYDYLTGRATATELNLPQPLREAISETLANGTKEQKQALFKGIDVLKVKPSRLGQLLGIDQKAADSILKNMYGETVRAPVAGELPGYRPKPGQAPAFGLSTQEVEPVGFGPEKKLTPGSQKYVDAFNQSGKQEVLATKGQTKFSLGEFGKSHLEAKTLEGKGSRFPETQLPDTIKNISEVYKGSVEPGNHRSQTAAWVATMPSGEKRVVYTKLNQLGQEEITGWHTWDSKNFPKYIDTLKSFGVPERIRTSNLADRSGLLNPLSYGDKGSIAKEGSGVNDRLAGAQEALTAAEAKTGATPFTGPKRLPPVNLPLELKTLGERLSRLDATKATYAREAADLTARALGLKPNEVTPEAIRAKFAELGYKSNAAGGPIKQLVDDYQVAKAQGQFKSGVKTATPGRVELPEHLNTEKIDIQNRKLALENDPARELGQYALGNGEFKGALPEVTGKGTNRFAVQGDDIAKSLGYTDSEAARAAYDAYKEKRAAVSKDITDFTKRVREYMTSAKDQSALERTLNRAGTQTERLTDVETRRAQTEKAFNEGLKRAADEEAYRQQKIAAINAARETPVKKQGFIQKVKSVLKPFKYLDTENKNIYNDWATKNVVAKELADAEFKNLDVVPYRDGMNEIRAYQRGVKTAYTAPIKDAFDKLFATAKARGFDLPYIEHYLPQVYKDTGEQITDAVIKYLKDKGMDPAIIDAYVQGRTELTTDQSRRLKLNPSFIKDRTFPSYEVAMKYGLTPKYTNPAQLAAHYRLELERSTANRELIEAFTDAGKILPVEFAPPGWQPINLPFSIKGYYAEPKLAQALNGIFRDENNLGIGATLVKGGAWISKRSQEIALSAGVPKTTINFFAMGQLIKELTAGNIKAAPAFVRANFTDATIKYFEANKEYLKKMADNGLDLGNHVARFAKIYKNLVAKRTWTEALGQTFDSLFNDKTFGSFMPQLHLQTFKDTYLGAIGKGMSEADAAHFATEVTRNNFGLIADVGRSKTTDDTLSTLFFAPKFREGIINTLLNTAKSASTEFSNPAFFRNRRLLAGMIITYGLYQALNYKLNGKYMWDNEPGKEFALRIPTSDGGAIYVEFMPSFLAFARNIGSGIFAAAKGDISTAKQKFGSVLSMPIKTTMEVWANKDYFGREIYADTDTALQKTAKIAEYVGLSINHPYIKETIKYLQDKEPLWQALSYALELPLKFAGKDSLDKQQFYAAMDKKATEQARAKDRVQPKYDEIQKLVEAGKTDEAGTLLDALSPEDYAIYKTLKASDKRRATTAGEARLYSVVQQVQALVAAGKEDEAGKIIDGLSEEDYRLYKLAKKRLPGSESTATSTTPHYQIAEGQSALARGDQTDLDYKLAALNDNLNLTPAEFKKDSRGWFTRFYDEVRDKLPFMEPQILKQVRQDVKNAYPLTDYAKAIVDRIPIKDIRPIEKAPGFLILQSRDQMQNKFLGEYISQGNFDPDQLLPAEEDWVRKHLWGGIGGPLFAKEKIKLATYDVETAGHEFLHALFERKDFDPADFNTSWESAVKSNPVLQEIDKHLEQGYEGIDDYARATERFAYLGQRVSYEGLKAIPPQLGEYYSFAFH